MGSGEVAAPGAEWTDKKSTELVKAFRGVQEERVQTYNMFDDAYKEYLKGAPNYDFKMYKHICSEIGKAFAAQSKHVNEMETVLRSRKHGEAADSIRAIQMLEKKKLEITTKMQVEGQRFLDNENVDSTDLDQLRGDERTIIADINEKLEELRYCDFDEESS